MGKEGNAGLYRNIFLFAFHRKKKSCYLSYILSLYSIDTHFDASRTTFENIVGKGEIARNKQFLRFPQCFLLNQIIASPGIFPYVSYYIFICCWIGRAQYWHMSSNVWYMARVTANLLLKKDYKKRNYSERNFSLFSFLSMRTVYQVTSLNNETIRWSFSYLDIYCTPYCLKSILIFPVACFVSLNQYYIKMHLYFSDQLDQRHFLKHFIP